MNLVAENPKASIVAITGIVIFILKTFVFKDSFTPEVESWLNVLLPTIILFLLGRFTRITKTEAKVLEVIEKKKEDDPNDLAKKNFITKGG